MARRTLLALLLAALAAPAQSPLSIAGDWKGTLDVFGNKLTLIFHILEPSSGDLRASMEVLEQKATVPVSVATYRSDQLTLEVPVIQGTFNGTRQSDGKSVRGTWKQLGLELPLILEPYDAPSQPALDTSAITAWMREHAVPLKTVEPGHGFDDLAPFKQMVGDARIVAVGEATHGTREFFQFKHRLLEFLVEQKGFTVFAIEANMPEARRVNEYVLEGKGDPGQALAGLYFWTWDTEEVLDLILWMCHYNADPAHTRKVKFYGFDMQVARIAATRALEYARRFDPDFASKSESQLLTPMSTPAKEEALHAAPDAAQRLVPAAAELAARLDGIANKDAAWREARQNARVVEQAVRMMAAGPAGTALRDQAMAANVSWILDNEGPDARIMLWAHNEHVAAASVGAFRPMGSYLREKFGAGLVVMGFAFNQGSFRAVDLGKGLHEFHVAPAPDGSLDHALAATKLPLLALDLRSAQGEARDWLRRPQRSRSIGSVFNPAMESVLTERSPSEVFDILLFVETTSAARGLTP